jgi:citrate lyase subunit beta / citryl-CoA lyase
MVPRSYLFVPGDRPDRFAKALATNAGRVIIDWEDAVAPADKAKARALTGDWLADNPLSPRLMVRVNPAQSAEYAADVAALEKIALAEVMLPKVEQAGDITALRQALTSQPKILILLETVVGYARLREIAAAPGLMRIAFGAYDFQVDADTGGVAEELDLVRSAIVLESRLAGLLPPIDQVCLELRDAMVIGAEAGGGGRLGCGGKTVPSPSLPFIQHKSIRSTVRSSQARPKLPGPNRLLQRLWRRARVRCKSMAR